MIKLYGLQRTCTNITKVGLKTFFNANITEAYGWKHSFISDKLPEDVNVVICVKNPFAWLDSMYRWGFHKDATHCPHWNKAWDFDTFLHSPHYIWDNPVLRYKAINNSHLDWHKDNTSRSVIVKAEKLQIPEKQVEIFKALGIKFKLKPIKTIRAFHKAASNVATLLPKRHNFRYYNNHQYMDKFSREQIKYIMGLLEISEPCDELKELINRNRKKDEFT